MIDVQRRESPYDDGRVQLVDARCPRAKKRSVTMLDVRFAGVQRGRPGIGVRGFPHPEIMRANTRRIRLSWTYSNN